MGNSNGHPDETDSTVVMHAYTRYPSTVVNCEHPLEDLKADDIPERCSRSVINTSNLSLYMKMAPLPNSTRVHFISKKDSIVSDGSIRCATNMGKKPNE